MSEAGKNITRVSKALQYTAAGAMQQAALLTGIVEIAYHLLLFNLNVSKTMMKLCSQNFPV